MASNVVLALMLMAPVSSFRIDPESQQIIDGNIYSVMCCFCLFIFSLFILLIDNNVDMKRLRQSSDLPRC